MSSNPEGSKASAKARAGNSTSPGFLEKIDRYGYIPQLMYGGDTACKSQFGGFLTFGEGLCYVFLVCFTVYRYFERKSPSTSLNRVFRQDPEGFSVTDSTMPFAFGIQNPSYEHFIDETVYKVEAFYTESIKTVAADGSLQTEYKKTKLNLVPCSQVGLDSKYFNNLELKSMFCLENYVTKKLDLKISGRFESNYFSRIEVSFKRCKGSGCKSNTEIDKLLRDSYFAINYKDRVAEPTQFESPVNQFPTSIFTSCSTDYLKYLHMYMADNTIVTDSSLVGYMELDRIRFPSTGTYKTDFSQLVRSGEDYPDVFFNMVLRMDPIENIYNRKYNNVYNYLAEFGGLTQIIFLAMCLFTFRFRHVYLNFDLAKKYLEKNKLYHHVLHRCFQDKQVALPLDSGRSEIGSCFKSANKVAPSPVGKSSVGWSFGSLSMPKQKSISKKFVPAQESNSPHQGQLYANSQRIEVVSQIPGTQRLINDQESSSKRIECTTSVHGQHSGFSSQRALGKAKNGLSEEPLAMKAAVELQMNHTEREALTNTNSQQRSKQMQCPGEAKSARHIPISLKKYFKDYQEYNHISAVSQKVSFWDFLVACVFPCGSKNSRLDVLACKSIETTYFNFDVLKVAKAIEEVDKLKAFLFSPEQAVLYDLLPRTHLRYVSEQKRFTFVDFHEFTNATNSDDISGMYDSVREALKSIKSSESHSEIDKKLIAAFNELISQDLQAKSS